MALLRCELSRLHAGHTHTHTYVRTSGHCTLQAHPGAESSEVDATRGDPCGDCHSPTACTKAHDQPLTNSNSASQRGSPPTIPAILTQPQAATHPLWRVAVRRCHNYAVDTHSTADRIEPGTGRSIHESVARAHKRRLLLHSASLKRTMHLNTAASPPAPAARIHNPAPRPSRSPPPLHLGRVPVVPPPPHLARPRLPLTHITLQSHPWAHRPHHPTPPYSRRRPL